VNKGSPPLALVPPPSDSDAGAAAGVQPVADAPVDQTSEVVSPAPIAGGPTTMRGPAVPWEVPDEQAPPPQQQPRRGSGVVAGIINVPQAASPRATIPPIGSYPVATATPFRVGPYEVATRIARGAMGSVYVCRNVNAGNPSHLFALKVIRQHTAQKELAAASFRHEALIGSLFRHPNAQTVIDKGTFEGQPYLVLDYVDGGCLADLLVPDTRPSAAVAVAIVLDLLAALSALHQTTDERGTPIGLVHCDVSPENVLVGADGVARLADFGSARIMAYDDQAHPFSVSKPPWMPPEQFTGDRLDASSDLYSVAVLLWAALTGHQPFAADVYDQTVMNVMRKKVPPASTFGAPAALDTVCAQAMSRFRDQRFLVADAMATALRSAAAPERLIASRSEVAQWVQRAMGEDLAQRRRIVASMFGSGPVTGQRPAYGAARAPVGRPMPSARASQVLSAKTLFIPAKDNPVRVAPVAEEDDDDLPNPRRSAAVFWVSIGLVMALAVGLTISSLLTHRRKAAARRAATISAPVPAPLTSIPALAPRPPNL
jgi:serine/threonine-protein kinase